jgi:uncharacterized protein YbjT (DUF2867 family)
MIGQTSRVLVFGGSGSIGRLAVARALEAGFETTGRWCDRGRAARFADSADVVVGDLTDAETLRDAVRGVTGVVFTHGSHGGAQEAEAADYGAVRNVLSVLKVLGLEAGVNLTVGLLVIRTSVDHGTAFDIAGQGKADHRSMVEALRLARGMAPEKATR